MTHRSALVTAGSIALVIVAGGIAAAANVGILKAADSSAVGKLSAAAPAAASQTQSSSEPAPQTSPQQASDEALARVSQKYVVPKAGSVTLAVVKRGIRLVDVSAKGHWKWDLAQAADKRLTVTFKKGGSQYLLRAKVDQGGRLLARVDHPVTRTVTVPGARIVVSRPAQVVAVASAPQSASPTTAGASHDDGGEGHYAGGEADD